MYGTMDVVDCGKTKVGAEGGGRQNKAGRGRAVGVGGRK